ncbi:MAG TPA: hypothetical protein VMN99_08500 [Anaerolineales bacterium]|nr:hypothetical protein [Anaerolineales bacterium]
MECPNCKHATSNTALLQCSHCGESFERGPLEEYQHLDYLADWLADRAEIGKQLKEKLLEVVGTKQDALLAQLLPKFVEEAKPVVEEVKPEPVLMEAEVKPLVVPSPVAQPTPSPQPKPKPAPKPAAPPKPKRPPVDWRKVITEAATSGALLRAMLYLGAFMIVVSAAVLVIRFWDQFNPVLQLVFIASVPITFYAGGWLTRVRLKLTQAGTVLTGIGAILVAVDFAAIFQLGGIGQGNGPLYWLFATILCTALYAFTAWRLQGEFFDYLTLIGGGSVLFTLTRLFRTPIEWSIVTITASGVLMAMVASRFFNKDGNWRKLASAARYLSQIVIPASVIYVMFSPVRPPVGHMMGFIFATVGYFVLAWKFPSIVFAFAALGASIGAVAFGVRVFDLPTEWYATVASILALMYILVGQRVKQANLDSKITQNYIKALNVTAFILVSLAAMYGLFRTVDKVWGGVIGLTLASLDLAICAYLFRKSRYTLLASGLFLLPFSIGMLEQISSTVDSQGLGWLAIAWGVLSLVYIGLAAVWRNSSDHARWLYVWAHVLIPLAVCMQPIDYLFEEEWSSTISLLSLGFSIAGYLVSFILHDSEGHPSLSAVSNWLPFGLGKGIFLWPLGFLVPIWAVVAWNGNDLPSLWLGTILAGFAIAYIGAGQQLFKRAKEYRLPFHFFVYLLCAVGILLSIPNHYSFSIADRYPLLIALLLSVTSTTLLAIIHNRIIETIIACLLFLWLFQLSMGIVNVPTYAQSLGYTLLASLVYTPIAIYLNKFQKSREKYHHAPVFIVGYAMVVIAIIASIIGRWAETFTPWVGVAVPLIATILFAFSASYFKAARFSSAWAWASVLSFAIAFGQALTLLNVHAKYDGLAWAGLATVYMLGERLLARIPENTAGRIKRFWFDQYHWSLTAGALVLGILGLARSLPDTFAAFAGIKLTDYVPFLLAQVLIVALTIASARLYQRNYTLWFEPFLAILPVTLFFIGYGERIFDQPLTTPQYALAWTGLGVIHLLAGMFTDRAKVRYAYGFYLGAYTLLSWAVVWSIFERSTLVWTLGVWILASITSALLLHFGRHQTWNELIRLLYGKAENFLRTISHNAFQWLAAWTFPIWCVLFLREINIPAGFSWLGFVVPPLAYLGLALSYRRVDTSYKTPLHSAAQFYTVIGLLISLPVTIRFFAGGYARITNDILTAYILIQATAVTFYAFSSWVFKSRGFAYIASWLSIVPFTIGWRTYGVVFTTLPLVVPWLIWATVLLAVGFTLDKNKTRYSHAAYLTGYALAVFALAYSISHRVSNIYALALTIVLALVSYLVVHIGRHLTFEDFIGRFWQRADETTRKITSTFFLFVVSYTLPVLLTQILAHFEYPLAWRGVSLALAAPLYIAASLLIRNAEPRTALSLVPTWALYSSGYALTAIGAMVSFGDERLATYVLALNAVVYAVSAYIFRQSFWLYLSTVLAPIIALLILHQTNRFDSNRLAWVFIGFAYVYLAVGQLFDRGNKDASSDIHPFAAPFYAPGFLLSAIALAVASSDRSLAIQIYSAGVVLYSIAGWLFRESLFLYPAAWLATVPYYLAITLTPLETRWYGLAWLPLILLYIALGRFVFHKQPLALLGKGVLAQWLAHPAVPFYLMAYALSISMISLSYISPLSLTLAFAAATIIYLASAYIFQTPGWIYAGLFTVHMTVLAYFTIDPSGRPAHYITLPFLGMTWITSLVGYAFERGIKPMVRHEAYKFTLFDRLFGHPWARPFFAFAIGEMILWQSVAFGGYDTTIILAVGQALLLALFAIAWTEGVLVYGVVGFSLLAVGAALKQAGVPFADAVAVFGGIGFGLYLLARLIEVVSSRFNRLTAWLTPLTNSSIALTALAVIVNLPFIRLNMVANAATLAFAGALYVTIAYRGRIYRLGYLGLALLQIAWVIVLFINEVSQPQLYAIPGGLYFMGIAFLELQHERKRYAIALEILGLGVLLVTSFAQSLNGAQGFPYFVLVLAESLLVIWWGTLQKRRIPFFTGIVAVALSVVAQVIVLVNVYNISIWLVAFGVGLLIIAIAIYIERGREQLRARTREWSETLEKWE